MTTLSTVLILTLATLSTLDAAPVPVCPLAGSSMASLEHVGNDPTAYELTFKWNRDDIPIDYVDYHYRINDGEFMNVRAYDGSTPATEATYPITLHSGDVLHAMVTYSSNRVGCDVAISEHRAPATASTAATATDETSNPIPSPSTSTLATPSHTIAATPISCTHINQQLVHDGTGFNIHTELPQDATKVDAHININGADPINVRMIPSSTPGVYELPSPFIAPVDSTINYYLTFDSDSETHAACDTQTWSTAAQASASASSAPGPDSTPAVDPRPPVTAPASVPAAARRRRVSMPPAAPAPAPAPATPSTPAAAETETAAPAPAAVTASSDPACSLPTITHRVMRMGATGNQYVIEATSAEQIPYAYIDVHTMVGDTENNARIGVNTASAHSEPITVPAGQALNYYLTYATDEHHACNTPMFSTGPMEA